MSKRDLKKDHILEAGLRVMKAQGYNGTSVKDIVDEAGVPKGSFYNYFVSKEAFAVEAIERCAGEGLQIAASELRATNLDPVARLLRFFKDRNNDCCEDDFRIGCFVGNMCQEMADSSDMIRGKVRHTLRGYTELIEAVLEEAKAEGRLGANTNCRSLAEFLFNAWEGAVMRMKAARSSEPLDAFLEQLPQILRP